jgi:hypothetical protein
MANYLVVNKPSNLILTVVSFRYKPTNTKVEMFIPASDKAIHIVDKWMLNNPGLLMDIGDLMSRSPYVHDYIKANRNPSASPEKQYYRTEQVEKTVDRLTSIRAWIAEHPESDEYELNDMFNTGMSAAKAYLARYSA